MRSINLLIVMFLLLFYASGCEKERSSIFTADDDDALFTESMASKTKTPKSPKSPKIAGKKIITPDASRPAVTPATPSGASKGTFISYGVRNGGRQAWRIPRKGPEFGKSIKVVFSDGHTVYVRDTSHNYRESDGFVFKPGIGPNGEGSSDTGTAHGGVYLHAPYGNRSKVVTIY